MARINLIGLLTREEPIAGLEISDGFLRLALLEKEPKTKETKIKFLTEESLAEGIIRAGQIKNKEELLKALQKLAKKAAVKIRYVVAALPADIGYSKAFSFPKSVGKEKLENMMNLTVGFQLPVKTENVYLDWEKSGEFEDKNEIFLSTAPKTIIDSYMEVLNSAGFKPVAIESHPLSFIRAVNLPQDKACLVKIQSDSNTAVFIIKNKTIRFGRVLPREFFTAQKSLSAEIQKIKDFFESEEEPIAQEIDLASAAAIDILKTQIKEDAGKWLVSLGAALRGIVPRAEDNLVSLMPVGTEQAYQYQKAMVFSEFISNITVGLSVFFVAGYLGVWLLLMSIQSKTSKQIENLSRLPVPAETMELEAKAEQTGVLIEAGAAIASNVFKWSEVLEKTKSAVLPGIIIVKFSAPQPEGQITVSGIALNRPILNQFKQRLEELNIFSEITVPLTNLELRENLPFTATVRLENPGEFAFQ